MSVRAPFRFAPISRWVYFPDWADLVSHDVPFADGWSGEIEFEIRAESPLLIGGARRAATARNVGEVWPFQLPDGRWAIPPSTLQGLTRSVLEIAAFGKMGHHIDDRRFGFRDIGNEATAVAIYRKRMTSMVPRDGKMFITQHARPGWLIRDNGIPKVVRCQVARIHLRDVARLRGAEALGTLAQRSDATERYSWFLQGGSRDNLNHRVTVQPTTWHPHRNNLQIEYSVVGGAGAADGTAVNGTLVFTGKPRTGTGPGMKKMEFFFHGPDRPAARGNLADALEVTPDVWDDFRLIHEEQPGRSANPNWKFWSGDYRRGRPVPIFYLQEEDRVATLGTAFMFKAAHKKSTHDLLRNSSPDHFDPDPDLPAVIFGSSAAGPKLKRRASFDTAIAELPPGSQPVRPTRPSVLLSPKPNYFPIYVRQPVGERAGELPTHSSRGRTKPLPYASYTPLDSSSQFEEFRDLLPEHYSPELAGAKIWPIQPADAPAPPGADAGADTDRNSNCSVQNELWALPVGTRFDGGKLRFHNLRDCEVGALLWALTFGDRRAVAGDSGRRHRLGMGKPLRMGAVAVTINGLRMVPNRAQKRSYTADELMLKFETAMREAFDLAGNSGTWDDSAQIRALRKASAPDQNADSTAFGYMNLESYVQERRSSHYLPPYVEGVELARQVQPPEPVVPEQPARREPELGARVRDRSGAIGVIKEIRDHSGKWLVHIGGKAKRLSEEHFDVI